MLVYRRVWLLNFDHSASRQLDTTAGVDFPHHVEMTFTEKPWFSTSILVYWVHLLLCHLTSELVIGNTSSEQDQWGSMVKVGGFLMTSRFSSFGKNHL